MYNAKKLAWVGAVAFALSTQAMAQAGGGASNGPSGTDAMGASGSMGMQNGAHGTTLHKQDKASHLKGAKAARAASGMGTNDKGAPH